MLKLNKRFLFAFALFFTTFLACRRLPNVQGVGEKFMQGLWIQDSVPGKADLLSFTEHNFKFSCDSFYVEFTTHAKVNYYEEECFNNGLWKEYAKGTYKVQGDTLFLVGTFTKANYKQKVSGCYRNGQYISKFKVKRQNKEKLILEGLIDHNVYFLTLKEKFNCIPKPL